MINNYNKREPHYPSYVDTNHFGYCLRASQDLKKGTIVATGSLKKTDKPYIAGHILEEHKYVALMDVDKNGNPTWGTVTGKWAFCNHSCDPNCDINERWEIITNRDLKKGQELTTSYDALVLNFTWQENWNFECLCQSPQCKKIINKYRTDIVYPIKLKE